MTQRPPESEFSAFVPSPDFPARMKRFEDAKNLRKPDRVPVAPLIIHFYPTKIAGISNKEAMYNMGKTLEAWKQAVIKHDWDAAPSASNFVPAGPLEILGMKQIAWPGGALRDDQPFQWVEAEYMKEEEYDEMLSDPHGFAVKKLWPRISTTLAPLGEMAKTEPPPLCFLSNAYSLPGLLGDILLQPTMTELLKKALELAEERRKNKALAINYTKEMMSLGYPLVFWAMLPPPFDLISDTLRGMRGSMLDMYRAPDKLLALIEMFTPLMVKACVTAAKESDNPHVFIPMHRGAAGFMSDKQFARFYWPSFKAFVLALIDAGLTPIPLFEGDFTPRLEYLTELPPKKIVGHFDQVDRRKVKELLGDIMCFWGNVPASVMCTGTPKQVKDEVKELIEIFGDNGGLIIDSTMGIPDEARPENVQALTEAVHEFGVY
jgi:uroporphyrinogen-III decarboxylase